MQQVFLSYTYRPHPDFVAESENLRRSVSIVIESMDLRVATGEDLGGEALTDEVKERIEKADALVALLTPWKDALGNKVQPQWVVEEFAHAKAKGKQAIRILHSDFAAAGMYAANEYIAFAPDKLTEVLLKVMRTLALWRKQSGRPMEIEITPDAGAQRFDPGRVKVCEYQVFLDYEESQWRKATIWAQPGALYAYLPGVPDQAKLRLRLQLDNETWQSAYNSPVGRVQLSRSQP
jgi:hypothetical protein